MAFGAGASDSRGRATCNGELSSAPSRVAGVTAPSRVVVAGVATPVAALDATTGTAFGAAVALGAGAVVAGAAPADAPGAAPAPPAALGAAAAPDVPAGSAADAAEMAPVESHIPAKNVATRVRFKTSFQTSSTLASMDRRKALPDAILRAGSMAESATDSW
jgi:hypothetical protein